MTVVHANKGFLLESLFAIELTFVGFVRVRVFRDHIIFIFDAGTSFKAMVVAGTVGETVFVLSKTLVHLIVVAVRIREALIQDNVAVILANVGQIERVAGFIENGCGRTSLFLLQKLSFILSVRVANFRAVAKLF